MKACFSSRLLLVLIAVFGLAALSGCAWLPWKKEVPDVAALGAEAGAPSATPQPTPAVAPRPTARKSWLDRIMFWRKPPPPSVPAQALVPRARVYLINQPARLVILEVPSMTELPEGLVLSGLKNGVVSFTVRVAPERRPPFAVAEILTGDPKQGETLYLVEP